VAITPYGQNGPHAQFAANDLTLAAMGGIMSVQGAPDRPPVRITVAQSWLRASTEAAVGALTAHARMLRSGEAQFVDVSAQTAMVWNMLHARVAHTIQGADFNRQGSNIQLGIITVPLVYECVDGYVVLASTGATMTKFVRWWVEEGIVPEEWMEDEDWPNYLLNVFQQQPVRYSMEEVLDATRRYARGHTKLEMLERGLQDGVTVAPVNNVEALARFRHLEERGYWLEAPLPNGGKVQVPGLFARLSATPMEVRRWPPRLSQHNQEVLGGMLGLSTNEIAAACGEATG